MALEQFQKHFGVVDFLVLIGLLSASASIGGYFAYKDRKQKSTDTYLFGGRNQSPIPVAMSMAVSFVSAITVIGYPVETYLYGLVILWMLPASTFGAAISALYYIPLIHRLQLSTIYQYLEMRFNKTVRKLVSGITLIEFTIYMGITVYLPALALNAVTPLSLNWTIAITSVVCTFYTVLGGMKAVIWTDMLQGIIMIFGSLALFVKTVTAIGGIDNVVTATQRGERNNFFNFNPDPRMRSTSFSVFLGMSMFSIVGSCCTQVFCQRYMSCRSARDAKIATFLRVIPVALFVLLSAANGLAMYAYYEGCDPQTANIIDKVDQTIPRLVIDVFEDIPGMAGLFVSAAYSGTLSTVSSGVNAMAAMTAQDFIRPHWKTLSDERLTVISKLVSCFFGAAVMGVAYVVSIFEATVIEVSMTLIGIIDGPILSVFTAGIFVPCINSKGAITGILVGWCVAGWVACSSIFHEAPEEFRKTLPLSIESCNFSYYTLPDEISSWSYELEGSSLMDSSTPAVETLHAENEGDILAETLYAISPFLLGVFGFLVAFVVTCLTSVITGRTIPQELDPKVFVPLVDNKILPKCVRTFFRFGVRELDMSTEEKDFALQPKTDEFGTDCNNVSKNIADMTSLLVPPPEPTVYIKNE